VKRPVWILHVFVVGLALHNVAMAELYAAGVRGTALDVVSAWKEALLALGLLLVLRAHGRRPFRLLPADWLALAYGAFVVLYALLPQHALGGGATRHGVLLALRHDLAPVAAYVFGRGLGLSVREFRALGATILATAVGVAAFGLIDIYAIPLSWWRSSGAPGWFTRQLGFDYQGLSGLPENFLYNTGNEVPLRRLVSSFLSPLASSYLLVVALLLAAAWRLRLRPPLGLWLGTVALLYAALLFTHSRSSELALAFGLLVFALARPQWRLWLAGSAVLVVGVGLVFVKVYPHVAPQTTYTPHELECQRRNAHPEQGPPLPNCGYQGSAVGPVRRLEAGLAAGRPAVSGISDASTESHWRSLRAGVETVLRHPQGYGLGNAGSTAARTGVTIKAGESTYTELGVETGLVGGLLFIAWSLVLLWRVLPCNAWLGASLAAVLALGLQTDVLGVPWLVYVLWPLLGVYVSRPDL
jgi:O-Antigen ligase